jgi:hypothetical protein
MKPASRVWKRAVAFATLACFATSLSVPTSFAQSGASQSSDAVSDGNQVGYLLADNVYTRTSVISPLVHTLTRDDRVRLEPVAEREGWFEVYRFGGVERVGYAFHPYVSRFGSRGPVSDSDAAPIPAEPTGTAAFPADVSSGPLLEVAFAPLPRDEGATRIVRTWANVRTGPGVGHQAFGVIRPGIPFKVLGIEHGWGRIRLRGEPSLGYVSASLLHRLPAPAPAGVAPPVAIAPTLPTVVGQGLAGGGVISAEATVADEEEGSQEDALRDIFQLSGVDAEAVVYVTEGDGTFHREGCQHLHSRTFAIPLVEAMMDYSPCRSCVPLRAAEPGE